MCDPGNGVQTTVENNEQGQGPAVRACRACSAPMQDGQDWCLSCGTAAPGRLGGRPGWRTVNSVAALTLVLVTGAVAASYAALSGDANSEAGRTAPASATPIPGPVAQLPDAPPTVTTPPPAASTPTTGATPFVPSVTTPPGSPVTPIVPATPVVPITPTDSGSGDGDQDTAADEDAGGDEDTSGEGTSTGEDDAPVTLTKIDLGADALGEYEPSKRIVRSGDPADAYDGNDRTAWSITTPDDGFPMQVGLLIDLEKARNVKEIDLGTTTPGGRIEVYGAVGSALPPDILDTRWEHVASQSEVDARTRGANTKGDGVEKIRLPGPGATGSRFRYVLLWFTTPPADGPTVRVTEVTLRG